MRIAHVTPYFHPHVGGVESFVGNLVKGLSTRGHEVTIITSRHGHIPEIDDYHGVCVRRIRPLLTLMETPVVPLISKEVENGNFDIIHTHTPPPVTEFYAAEGAKGSKRPLIISYHGDPEPAARFGSMISRVYQLSFGIVALRLASKIIVHTRTYAATSRAIWNYDPVIIPSAVDLERFNPTVDSKAIREKLNVQDKKVVLFVGRLVPTKGIEYFIRSAQYTDSNTMHLIVGSGELEKDSRALVKRLGVEKKVLFTGRVNDNELPGYYSACDIFILPSVSRLEGFGLVTLEAMSTGKPVLVSDIPGVREVIKPESEGLLIEPMNPKDIAEKINLLLGDDKMRKRFGENARISAEMKYSWETVIKRIEEVYVGVSGQ